MPAESEYQLQRIRESVDAERRRTNIIPRYKSFDEGPCFAAGEDKNLFYQLVHTPEPERDWVQVLRFPEIRQLVFDYVLALTDKRMLMIIPK